MPIDSLLKNISVFSEFSDKEIATISQTFTLQLIAKGTKFIQEGEACNSLYLLAEGSVQVTRKKSGGNVEEPLGLLYTGSIIGLVSLFDRGQRSASCNANSDVMVACASYDNFDKLCNDNSSIHYKFQFAIARQLASDMRVYNKIIYRAINSDDNISANQTIFTIEYRGLERRESDRRNHDRRKIW